MATEAQPLGQDAAWLGKYDDVHMHVFGTPLRVLDHGQGMRVWTSTATNTSTSSRASR